MPITLSFEILLIAIITWDNLLVGFKTLFMKLGNCCEIFLSVLSMVHETRLLWKRLTCMSYFLFVFGYVS